MRKREKKVEPKKVINHLSTFIRCQKSDRHSDFVPLLIPTILSTLTLVKFLNTFFSNIFYWSYITNALKHVTYFPPGVNFTNGFSRAFFAKRD
jgi:hypothetical protein